MRVVFFVFFSPSQKKSYLSNGVEQCLHVSVSDSLKPCWYLSQIPRGRKGDHLPEGESSFDEIMYTQNNHKNITWLTKHFWLSMVPEQKLFSVNGVCVKNLTLFLLLGHSDILPGPMMLPRSAPLLMSAFRNQWVPVTGRWLSLGPWTLSTDFLGSVSLFLSMKITTSAPSMQSVEKEHCLIVVPICENIILGLRSSGKTYHILSHMKREVQLFVRKNGIRWRGKMVKNGEQSTMVYMYENTKQAVQCLKINGSIMLYLIRGAGWYLVKSR